MRILYVVPGLTIPGSHGGSVHALEVSRGLTRLGHKVHTVARRADRAQPNAESVDGFTVHRLSLPTQFLMLTTLPAVHSLAWRLQPDVVMERYYNFGGAGIITASRLGVPSVLEVNGPPFDPPGSFKDRVDALMLRAFSRYAKWQCLHATRIVTPLPSIIPSVVPRERVRQIHWGANVELFNPDRINPTKVADLRRRLSIGDDKRVVVFLGSFRRWHGVWEFVHAAELILARRGDVTFLMIGSGELFDEVESYVRERGLANRLILAGQVDYSQVPIYLALADVGVAPFDTAAHPPLRMGFYWSPLKVFEYMAMSLPVVTIDIAPLNEIVRAGQEGLLYREGDSEGLVRAIEKLVDEPELARRLGASARERVTARYSWQVHCEQLEAVLRECVNIR
jgi:glycosyltransferase involved in cell wall biosynthesis